MYIISICIHKLFHGNAMLIIKGLEQLTCQERIRELDCSAWRRETSGDHMNVHKYLKWGSKEDRASLFSGAQGCRKLETSTAAASRGKGLMALKDWNWAMDRAEGGPYLFQNYILGRKVGKNLLRVSDFSSNKLHSVGHKWNCIDQECLLSYL